MIVPPTQTEMTVTAVLLHAAIREVTQVLPEFVPLAGVRYTAAFHRSEAELTVLIENVRAGVKDVFPAPQIVGVAMRRASFEGEPGEFWAALIVPKPLWSASEAPPERKGESEL